MVVGFVGIGCIVGFVELEFSVVHMSISAHILTKSASSTRTESS